MAALQDRTAVIVGVDAWEALDSRGRPTVAARVVLAGGVEGVALVPSGRSAGSHEAVELRDGGPRYAGRGVRLAVRNVIEEIAPRLIGLEPEEVDTALATSDASAGFAILGSNAVLAVSLASARAAAAADGVSLPRRLAGPDVPLLLPMPMVNVVSGGAHAGGMVDIQDLLVVPVGAASFAQAIEWASAVREAATELAQHRGHHQAVLVADEGGIGLRLPTNYSALLFLCEAIEEAGLSLGDQAAIAIDLAATQFFSGGLYHLISEGRTINSAELVAEIARWCDNHPIVSVEDILAEDDWNGWREATEVLGDRVQLVGDDLFVTSEQRLRRGIEAGVANSILVKPNQNGLVTGAQRVLELARSAGYSPVVSARSGDTEDVWLADLAVGWAAGQIKVGSTHRSERTAKWNRLLQLEATENTVFAGPWKGSRPKRMAER